MNRQTIAQKIWWDTDVPFFLEKFIVPVLAVISGALIIYNPWKFDLRQRASLLIAIIAVAYFLSHSLHLRNEAIRTGSVGQSDKGFPSPRVNEQTQPKASGNAVTTGSKSPAVTGDNNKFNYGQSPEPKKQKPKSPE